MSFHASDYTLDIGIVGGGISGLCLALGLDNKGVKATVYDLTSSYREVDADISLAPNAIKALNLVDPSLTKGVLRAGSSNKWSSHQDTVFNFRQGQNTEDWNAFDLVECVKHPLGFSMIKRADFLDEAFKILGSGVVQFSRHVVSISCAAGGRASLFFEDGTQAQHDLVVGCDGIHSIARKYVLGEGSPDAWPNWSNQVYRRGLVDMDKAISIIGEECATNSATYLGDHAHLVTFPNANYTQMHVGGYVRKAAWAHEWWLQKTTRQEMLADFKGWAAELTELMGQLEETETWAIFDLPHGRSFFRDRVALMGDAAHASTPFQGSGSSMAVEDAYVLSNLLASVTRADQVPGALQAYDLVRRPRDQESVRTSQDIIKILQYKAFDSEKHLDRIKAELRTKFDWIWNEDLEAESTRAIAIMGQHAT